MIRYEQRVIIDAPVEAVCAYILDPAHMQEYIGASEVEIGNIQRLPNGGYRYTAREKVLGMQTTSTLEDVEVVPNERTETEVHSALLDGVTSWRFQRLADGKTSVSIVEEFRLHGGPLGRLGEALFNRFLAKSANEGVGRHMKVAKARIESSARAATVG